MDGLTGLATFFIIKAASIAVITIIGIVASILWVGSPFYIRTGYIQTLNEALAARRLNFDDLQIGSINHAMVDTIDSSLKTGDVYEQLFILELIQSLPPKHWKETLESLMVTGSNPVRKAILQYAGDLFDDDVIVELVKEPFLDAIPICGKRKCEQAISALTQLLNHESSEVRISAAGSLIRIGTESSEQASSIIQNAISDEDPYIIARGLNNAILDESILSDERLIQFLQHDTSMIRIAAMSLATQSPQDDYLPFIIENLGSPKTSGIARNSLEGFKDDLILASIQKMSEEPNLTTTMKNGMISTLSNIPSPRSQQLLLSFFNPSRIDTYESAADALLTMAESTRLSKPTLKHVQSSIRFLAKKDYSLHQFRYLLRNYNHTTLLIDTLDADATSIMPVLIKLGAMDSPGVPINQCIKSLKSNDPAQVSYGLDLMETIFSREEREIVTPLIEHRSLQERVRTGKKLFRSISKNIYFYMEDFLYSESQWKSAIALEFLLNSTHSYKGPVRWDSVPVSHLHAELLHRVDADNYRWIGNLPDSLRNFPPSKIMFTTLENTIMLKSVPLFKDIPAEVISAIAQISEEVQTEADSVLFKEGDSGDSMFVIVEGDIRIHKGEKVIATLSKWDCLGEMALLDEEPRSADATAASDGIILQISQDSFSELMQQHPNIMKSLLKILTGRLRNVI